MKAGKGKWTRVCACLIALALLAAPCAAAQSGGVLGVGASGALVRQLQQKLIALGYLPEGEADGRFGTKTRSAVAAFQKDRGLEADGVYGPLTASEMEGRGEKPAGVAYPILHTGDSGAAVKALQEKLILRGYLDDAADGVYGARTREAVTAFQRDRGLAADGVCGPDTGAALGDLPASRLALPEEIFWLARIIHAEAQGEPYLGQLAVGNVVMNRVESRAYPDSVYEVIFQDVQFTPAMNGTVYNTPSVSCVRAAWAAYRGKKPVGSCLYFISVTVRDSWVIRNRALYQTIGNHRFFL